MDLRKAALEPPSATAVGADQFRPRHWHLASNGALSLLGYILRLCEAWGIWPRILRHVHIVVLAKPS
eukprot:4166428-Pyramimonas_sp.AAC.1